MSKIKNNDAVFKVFRKKNHSSPREAKINVTMQNAHLLRRAARVHRGIAARVEAVNKGDKWAGLMWHEDAESLDGMAKMIEQECGK